MNTETGRGPWPDPKDDSRCQHVMDGGLIEPPKQCVLDAGHDLEQGGGHWFLMTGIGQDQERWAELSSKRSGL